MQAKALTVFHVMRTYGNHGGERQLAQMFAQPAPEASKVNEHFAFLYRDDLCEHIFPKTLRFHRLWPFALTPRYSAWREMALLLPILPWMQLRLLYLLLRYRARVCIVHGFQAALVAWPSAMLLRHIGFAYFHRITKSRTGRHPLFKLIYAPYKKLIGVSLAVRDSLAGLADNARLYALENGVDVEHIQRASSTAARHTPPVIIAVGRLLPHKGQLLIIEAFKQCWNLFPDLELWIVGDGEYRAALEAAAGGTVQFLGRREDIPQLLGQATIFCNASEWEGMSNAVLEAMAAGLASVVADAPGVTECHIDNVTGFVVKREAQALAEKLLELLKHPELRQTMGQAALSRAREHYSIQANRKKYLRLYQELAACAG